MFEAHFLVMGLSYLAASAIGFYTYFEWLHMRLKCSISNQMLFLGTVFAIPLLMYALWFAGILDANSTDELLINGLFSIFVSIVMLLIVHKWTNNRNLLFLLALYLISIVFLAQSLVTFYSVLVLASFALSLIAFLELYVVSNHHIRRAGFAGTAYSLVGIILIILGMLNIPVHQTLWALPNFLFALVLFFLYKDGRFCLIINPKKYIKKNKEHYTIAFARYILYIISISVLMFVATIAIHESGHAISALYYGCEHSTIKFDFQNAPHTEIACTNSTYANIAIITLSGLIFTLFASIMLYLTDHTFSKRLAELMAGLGFLLMFNDFRDIGLSINIIILVSLLALVVVVLAIINISLDYIFTEPLMRKIVDHDNYDKRRRN